MPRRAKIEFVSLHSSLVNLPISVYGPLIERHVRPQSLAVHLSSNPPNGQKIEAYVGWTGMAASSSLARFQGGSNENALETLEIDPQFAGSLGLHLGDVVDIGLVHDLPIATSVTTEPVTADDWEIVELHASYVEQNLLSQVRVAFISQEVDVWVFGRTRARLLVTSCEPPPGKSRAALLSTNTEVSIVPKGRKPPPQTKTPSKDVGNGANEASSSSIRISRLNLRIIPNTFFSIESTSAGSRRTAWVSAKSFCKLCSKDYPPGPGDMLNAVAFHRIKAPESSLANESSTPTPSNSSSARVIHGGDSAKASFDASTSQKPVEEKISLQWSSQIPEGQVVFDTLPTTARDWTRCFLSCEPRLSTTSVSQSAGSIKAVLPIKNHSLIGIDSLLEKCTDHLAHSMISQSLGKRESLSGILLTGRAGTGKTSVASTIANLLEASSKFFAHTIYTDFSKHAEDKVGQVKAALKHICEKALWHRPCVLVFDNLDKLLSVEQEHSDSFRNRQLADLFISVFQKGSFDARHVALIATAESESSIHPRITSSHLFKVTFKLKAPSREARRDILSQAVCDRLRSAQGLDNYPTTNINFTTLATQTEGYSPTDLKDLTSVAFHQATMRLVSVKRGGPLAIVPEDFEKALAEFTPLSLRDVKLQKSTVSWNDIGGLNETRRVLRETLEWPTKYSAIFAKCPLRLRSGILLYGYPGCGKTLLASAVAKECGLNFISVKGPEILNKYIGASEQSVRDLFDRASAAKPCVLFFDEFDSIAPKRGHDSTGVTDRVVNQMLTQMDGAEGLDGVYVLAATSRPDLIDPALLRPGRLDKSLLCDMPNSSEREEILRVVSRKVNASPSIDWREVASATDGFSGADLQALVYNAHLEAVHASISDKSGEDAGDTQSRVSEHGVRYVFLNSQNAKTVVSKAEEAAVAHRLESMLSNRINADVLEKRTSEQVKHKINVDHLSKSLSTTRPSVPAEERARLMRIYNAFVSDRSGDLPLPPEEGAVGSRASLM
ncbi:AAA-domain-containing protein [Schizopora paradoxa]|uniref:Peroxisomal ATPase PEX1 n=1 Tax=Schizopora paradoxa TaxID=27342 RepID=A0A0H2RZW5_9AGAM|nr:AAA-domain-containing protein [Schizopora paradoxa]